MQERARRADLGDIAFAALVIIGLVGVYLLAGFAALLVVGGFGGAALLWRAS